MKRVILILIGLGLLGIVLFGYYQINKTNKSISDLKVDISISAEELLQEFEMDEPSANSVYLDKVLSVTGILQKIEQNGKKLSLYLDTGNPLSAIICELEDSNAQTKYKSGSLITVKGICTGYLMDVILIKSEVI